MTDWSRPEEKEIQPMAACVNKIILVGYLGKDPEQRFTQSGRPVTSFTLATSESWKIDDGVGEQRTEWFNVVVWNPLAEVSKTYLGKHSRVHLPRRPGDCA
jgi:single-strand DNA-binding protein